MAAINYQSAGVNRELADRLVDRISILTKKTLNSRVKSSLGGYASLFALDQRRWIAASTDGVGTKLKLAFALGKHDTVGIDLVAMSVNDLLCTGAEPLFFLDYFATGKLDNTIASQVIAGIVEGCKQSRCALVGGETAEMPDFYTEGEYDLAGFAVGYVESKQVLPQKKIKPGDILIGVASSGFHSNGFSLLRKLLPNGFENIPQARSIAEELLTPTRIYVQSVWPLIKKKKIKALAHITGSGFLNVPRMSDQVNYELRLPKNVPAIFDWVKRQSGLELSELAQTFNMGIGLVMVIKPQDVGRILSELHKKGEKAWEIGRVTSRKKNSPCEVKVTDQNGESTILRY